MRKIIAITAIISAHALFPTVSYAQDVADNSEPATLNATPDKGEVGSDPDKKDKEKDGQGSEVGQFLANFSVGAAVLIFQRPSVETAEFVGEDRIVVITESKKHTVTPWLQANYVWDNAFGHRRWPFSSTAPGVFAGVGMGPDGSFLDTFGIGGQLSFLRVTKNNSLNLGVGYYFTAKKEFAPGIVEGESLPSNYEQVKIIKKSANGVMINLSFGFQ